MIEDSGENKLMHSKLTGVKIACVSTTPFSVMTQLKDQIKHLSNAGALITVVTGRGIVTEGWDLPPNASHYEINIVRNISPLKDLFALVGLIIFFYKNSFDIIHSTTPKAGLLASLAGFIVRVPIRLHTFTGQRWVHMQGLSRFLVRQSDSLIGLFNTDCYADSCSQKEFLIKEKVIKKNSINVISSGSLAGVDLDRFNANNFSLNELDEVREVLGISKESHVLLFVGRITKDKGVDELVEAFMKCRDQYGDLHLILLGPIDSNDRKGIIDVSKLRAIDKIHVLEYTHNPEKYMAIADILCLPSYREGFGTVIIEAASMGVPAIGTQIYGLSDAISDGVTGLLVRPRDSEDLARAIKLLLDDSPLRIRLGHSAKKRAFTNFSSKLINEALVAEYCRLLMRRN